VLGVALIGGAAAILARPGTRASILAWQVRDGDVSVAHGQERRVIGVGGHAYDLVQLGPVAWPAIRERARLESGPDASPTFRLLAIETARRDACLARAVPREDLLEVLAASLRSRHDELRIVALEELSEHHDTRTYEMLIDHFERLARDPLARGEARVCAKALTYVAMHDPVQSGRPWLPPWDRFVQDWDPPRQARDVREWLDAHRASLPEQVSAR
jgi:hypothetical protein